MKRIILLAIILILTSINVLALDTKDLNYYSSIDVNVTIGSNVNILPESNNYIIEDFNAELSIFPRAALSEFQTIKKLDMISNPKASISANENSITYKWSKPQEKRLSYFYNADINSRVKFREIKEKVRFPIRQEDLPDDIMEFTRPNEFIQSEDPEIIKLANQLAEGSDDLYDVVFKISKWTNNNINYSLETLTAELQQPSNWVLQNKKGVCDELTVLTIAMLRSLGIPTKFVSGSSYTDTIGDFGNHAWLEVYFPKYGWIQFDPTYGQYGFVDATHIKMKSSRDAKEGAVNYAWRSKDVEVTPEKLNINVSVKGKGEKLKPLLDLKIKPLKNKVSEGSSVPLEITVENKNNFYVPATLHITKAPTQLFNNKVELLLKPQKIKKYYFIVKIPDNIKDGFTYASTVEIADFFNSRTETELEFSRIYEHYSEEKAQELVQSLTEEEQKIYSSDVDLNCNSNKKLYYKYENTGIVSCILKNNGNTNIENLKVCLSDDCKEINIPISRSSKIGFSFILDNTKDLKITAENKEILKHSFLSIKVLESPDLVIEKIDYPQVIKYKENSDILFTIKTEAAINNLTIDVDDRNIFFLYKLGEGGEFKIPFEGSYFFNKESKLKIKYKDENGKEYYLEQPINITVTDIPFFPRLLAKIKNLFK